RGPTWAAAAVAPDLRRGAGLTPPPAFGPFTPWATLDDYLALLGFLEREHLLDQVDPVQLAIRLLVPPGSLLLSRPGIRPFLAPLDAAGLTHRWTPPDPRHDAAHRAASALVEGAARASEDPTVTLQRARAV